MPFAFDRARRRAERSGWLDALLAEVPDDLLVAGGRRCCCASAAARGVSARIVELAPGTRVLPGGVLLPPGWLIDGGAEGDDDPATVAPSSRAHRVLPSTTWYVEACHALGSHTDPFSVALTRGAFPLLLLSPAAPTFAVTSTTVDA